MIHHSLLRNERSISGSPPFDFFARINLGAHLVALFNLEPPSRWGARDGDMFRYVMFCTAERQVIKLAG
jgi:hypothetical protein